MKNWKKIATAAAAVALSATLVFSATACSDNDESSVMSTIEIDDSNMEAWLDQCAEIYGSELSEFYEVYQQAKEENDTDKRYALMAVAEAKMLESAVFMPSTSSGGSSAISRVAPHTYTTVGWGTDSYRYHQALVTTEFITSDDRDELYDIYYDYVGTGNDLEGTINSSSTTAYKYSNEVKTKLSELNYTTKSSYAITYSSKPAGWDILTVARANVSSLLVNTYDNLVEYDELGNLQYALADQIVVSDDGLTYYFHIRSGVNWYMASGTDYNEDVTADDFVAGFQHMLDGGSTSSLYSIVNGIIKGVGEYVEGTGAWSDVGVEAGTYNESTDTWTAGDIDSTTGAQEGEWVAYTLESECSYFMSLLTYNPFAPMNRSYYRSLGGAFGSGYNSASNYTYGTSRSTILYCGPYLIESYQDGGEVVFKANAGYWNAGSLNIDTITWYYNDGTSASFAWNKLTSSSSATDYATLNETALQLAKNRTYGSGTYYSELAYTTENGSSTYPIFLNINRKAYSNAGSTTTGVTTKSELEAYRTSEAMLNVHFRRALLHSIDRETYNAMSVGDDLALASLRNTYVPGDFVQCSSTGSVTYTLSGETYTVDFSSGDYYGKLIQDQLTKDGSAITVWAYYDEDGDLQTEGESNGYSTDGYDGWYNPTAATAELEQAITELSIDGIKVSSSNPIQIDYIYVSSNTTYTNMANALKQSIENATNGCIQVNLIGVSTSDDWYASSYNAEAGYQMNFDISDNTGWGPDYKDPSTYLDTFLPDGAGYMVMMIGLWSN